ncbi:MAG: hypothetical protein K2M19_04760 [Muribaculaceae bacterium]|nr:hypothetical protein [Muribaculaceae bacterium]
MKKFYILTLAALMTLGAGAATTGLKTLSGKSLRNEMRSALSEKICHKTVDLEKTVAPLLKSNSRAEAKYTIEGDYNLSIGDYYFQNSVGPMDVDATITNNGDETVAMYSDVFMSVVIADYNAATGKLSFMPEDLGPVELNDGTILYARFEPGYYDAAAKAVVSAPFSATFDSSTGVISFPEDHNFGWAAYTDKGCTVLAGYLEIFDMIEMTSIENVDSNEGWEDWGEATLQDGWVLPAFDVDQFDETNWYKVPIQKSTEFEGMFRLVNPYLGHCPVAKYNSNTKGGYIVFDISDPDHVFFDVVKAGFTNAELGVGDIYCYNTLTWAAIYYGVTPVQVVEEVGDEIPYSTYSATEKVLTLPCVKTATGIESDACFGITGATDAGYGWQDANKKPQNMETKIFFDASKASVSDVITEATEGVKEYFNLQGVRVANPSTGVYIVRQSGKATKEFVR